MNNLYLGIQLSLRMCHNTLGHDSLGLDCFGQAIANPSCGMEALAAQEYHMFWFCYSSLTEKGILRSTGVGERWRPLSCKRHGGLLAAVPTVRVGKIGSLLGSLADREGGAGGATGGALTGGVTEEVDVGTGL
jgi:hypothetical protein